MMKTYQLPLKWDAGKFATRYGLDMERDFYVREGELVVFPVLPNNPPIFDPPDSPGPTLVSRINQLSTGVSPQLKEILLELARGR